MNEEIANALRRERVERELAQLEKNITESYMQAINSEILWCEKYPDPAFHAEYRKGFINGLIQAKYLIQKVREESELW